MFHYEIKEPKLEIQPLQNYNIIINNLKCLFYKDIEFIFKKVKKSYNFSNLSSVSPVTKINLLRSPSKTLINDN